jgi:hypothetical protein
LRGQVEGSSLAIEHFHPDNADNVGIETRRVHV